MFRIGYAEDIHRLVEKRKLILGHVEIDCHLGLLGHSDADVVLHAITESILGALALGDLGKFFPDTDAQYRGIDSSLLLLKVRSMMEVEGYIINNLDVTILAEKPKLAPYIAKIRQEIANLCQMSTKQVSVKAGTNEGLDAVGRGEAIKAIAIILLRKKELK